MKVILIYVYSQYKGSKSLFCRCMGTFFFCGRPLKTILNKCVLMYLQMFCKSVYLKEPFKL